ncbi:MAG: membrane protein insertase YidC [Rhodospirillaceae bacterium]|nr:MAG: membrane protein insertase YidC [Rhodospirillaceae bacterium]
MGEQQNFLIAAVISLAILIGWQTYFAPKPQPKPVASATQTRENTAPVVGGGTTTVPNADGSPSIPAPVTGPRLAVRTPHLHGEIALTGLRFDDITLATYHETHDLSSPEITLLSPASAPKPYYAEEGWISESPTTKVPGPDTVWTPENPDATLTDTTPVVVTWDNGEGLRFVRTIHVDQNYLFTTEQTVENHGDKAVTLYPYALVARLDKPEFKQIYLSFEGPLGVFDRTEKDVKYDTLKKEGRETVDSTGGWIGITDKYWLTAVAFDQSMKVVGSFNHTMTGERDRYQTDLRGEALTLQPGESRTVKSYVFAGAKELELLDGYANDPGLSRFDLAIDFGWFYFLTKPFFYALLWLKGALGNFGLAILALTTVLRLLMFPIANKQFAAMAKMKALQPEMKRLQERHANDRTKLNQEMMELYKREKANPVAGCLPILIQIPVFFALYKVLYVTIEMRQAPFYGWIHDLSAPDPTTLFNIFGLLPFTPPSFLHIGALPILYGITMFLQQRLSPQPADPVQARMMMFMPLFFTFLFGTFPAGFVIYWVWSNTLGILQQWVLTRRNAPQPAKA